MERVVTYEGLNEYCYHTSNLRWLYRSSVISESRRFSPLPNNVKTLLESELAYYKFRHIYPLCSAVQVHRTAAAVFSVKVEAKSNKSVIC